jgi:hypothetical protein
MADSSTIQRIAKILARVTSDNAGEADTALHSALARMKRDGVTLRDLLTLPESDLYQSSLVKLAELIVQEQTNLSQSARRELYAKYLALIVLKFSGGSSSPPGDDSTGKGTSKQSSDRESQRKEYEQRSRDEEARRAKDRANHDAGTGNRTPPPENKQKPEKQENGNTQSSTNVDLPLAWDSSRFPFSFSPARFFSFLFGSESFIGCIYGYPGMAFKLFFNSLLVGGVTAVLIAGILLYIHSTWQIYIVAYIFTNFFHESYKGYFLIIFITAYIQYEKGYFPRMPRHGETDFVSIAMELWRLILFLLWRVVGLIVWLGNMSFMAGAKWRQSREK